MERTQVEMFTRSRDALKENPRNCRKLQRCKSTVIDYSFGLLLRRAKTISLNLPERIHILTASLICLLHIEGATPVKWEGAKR